MRWRQLLLALALIVPAVAFEMAVLSRLGLPGATPDLVAVLVGALAATCGAGVGSIAGFVAGMLLDLVPPADGTVGVWAVGLTLVGYVIGSRYSLLTRSRTATVAEVALAGPVAALIRLLLGGLLGDSRVVWQSVPTLLTTDLFYCFVLATLVFPVVVVLARRLTPAGEARIS